MTEPKNDKELIELLRSIILKQEKREDQLIDIINKARETNVSYETWCALYIPPEE